MTCREVRRQIETLASGEATPAGVRAHLAGCRACSQALAAARLARGLVRAAGAAAEPPAGFAERLVAGLAEAPGRPVGADMWRPAWGLVPTFAAILMALLLWGRAGVPPEGEGYLAVEGATLGERLVLAADERTSDALLGAVLEVDEP